MSYTVLARKWRPHNFAEMAGQEHVLRALINALDNDRLHHGFLFTGTRGVGKTTVARILAKCINCEKGVTSTPCGECSTCQEIDDGRFVDLIEVDAASRTKVDDTRDLLDKVQYAPTSGRYKVYLIDEVHMLSRHSFNAMLKTLEEPPPHVKFLLATTDPQRLPATVLSRCLQFNLKRMPLDLISGRLQEICEAEKFKFDASAIELLAHGADGSMRDGLSLLDQAIAYGGGTINEPDVRSMLGTVERNKVFEVARALAAKDAGRVLELIAAMDEYAPDYGSVLQELALLLQRVAIFIVAKAMPRESKDLADIVSELAEQFDAEDVQLLYQIAIIGRRDLPLAPDVRSGFEMVLLRMLAFLPDAIPTRTTDTPSGAAASESAKKKQLTAPTKAAVEPPPASHTAAKPTPPTSRRVTSAALPASASSSAHQADFSNWATLIELIGFQGAARQLAANCVVEKGDHQQVVLRLATENQHMLTQQVQQKLVAVMQNHFGDAFGVTIKVADVEDQTPAQLQQAKEAAHQQAIRDSLLTDPNVKLLMETFDATIHEESIKPIN